MQKLNWNFVSKDETWILGFSMEIIWKFGDNVPTMAGAETYAAHWFLL